MGHMHEKEVRNVRLEIACCSSTECPQHKEGSVSAELYAKASKTTSNFLRYLLCPLIQRDELAVQVMVGLSTFAAEMETAKSKNIVAAVFSGC
jgi:hydrogenase/urease accessory protein HupE